MKRFHVHVAVDDLAANIRFYSTVFGAQPSVLKDDYAKWMLEDPRVNFAISRRGSRAGLDHLGLQVDSGEELTQLRSQVSQAEMAAFDQQGAACCYAKSDKYWITDPQGIAWETFHTLESIPMFGNDVKRSAAAAQACCAPAGEPIGASANVQERARCCG
jgi:catechol 2,3-dioxygenase-like lactoylglutathione lyase family enzyme